MLDMHALWTKAPLPCLPCPDNPIQPTWILALGTKFERIPVSEPRSQQGPSVESPPQKSSCEHVGKAPYLGAGESQRHLKRSLVLYQLHLYCPAPDQLCSQEEIGSNVKGSQSQVWKARVQGALSWLISSLP